MSRQQKSLAKQEPPSDDDYLHITEEAIVPIRSHKETAEWNVDEFIDRIDLTIVDESEDKLDIEFDLINVGSSIANAIRRVLIAEVPSMAIEKVYLYQNTSVIPDEVLCHRLGLLPVYANPSHFDYPSSAFSEADGDANAVVEVSEEPAGEAHENVIFELHVRCKNKKAVTDEPPSLTQTKAERLYENAIVRAKQFKWVALGKQMKMYSEDQPRIVNEDIVVAKLRPGQEIEARCHCVKGVGRDHAKFSPVATASYRLLPEIRLQRPIGGEEARRLQACFTKGVIEIDAKTDVAYVKDARRDTCSRNVFQHEEFRDAVFLGKNPEHFIFNVESTGAVSGGELVLTSTRVLRAKLRTLKTAVCERLDAISMKAAKEKRK